MNKISIPDAIHRFIDKYEKFLILGHSEPDGDCIGSQLTLARYLTRKGKDTALFSPGPFRRPEIQEYEVLFRNHIPESEITPATAVFIVDCSTIERIGSLAPEIEGLPLGVIDHHSSGNQFGTLRFIEPEAPSVTYLIQLLIESSGMKPDLEEARLLLFGLCTDTGFFRHLQAGTAEVFQAIGRLVEAGTSTREIHSMIYGNRSFESRKLLGLLLSRTEQYFNGKVIITWETLHETESYGIRNRDSDTLYQFLQAVAGCEIVILIREEYPDTGSTEMKCSVGIRSRSDKYDVGRIAGSFGGGGHKQAAGFTVYSSLSGLKDRLLSVCGTLFP